MPKITRKSQGFIIGTQERMPDIKWHKIKGEDHWINTWGAQVIIRKKQAPNLKYYHVVVIGDSGRSDGSFGGKIYTNTPCIIKMANTLLEARAFARSWMKENFNYNRPVSRY